MKIRSIGEMLRHAEATKRAFPKRRSCFGMLDGYMADPSSRRTCCLYGLRRTGKTVMMEQACADLISGNKDAASRTMWATCDYGDYMDDLRRAVDGMAADIGFLFLDEVTKLGDFVSASSYLADELAVVGVKVVMAGTDSLGFALARKDALFDRVDMIHTTYIPYREFREIKGLSLDEYVMHGGTLTDGKALYNGKEDADAYTNSAITGNIIHSIAQCEGDRRYGPLSEAYENGDIGSYIERTIEQYNRKFTISALNKEFRSHDYGSLKDLAAKRRIDRRMLDAAQGKVVAALADGLGIKAVHATKADEKNIGALKAYLEELDLLIRLDGDEAIFTQPGMRYCQAEALVAALARSDVLEGCSPAERAELQRCALSDIKGRMLEDILFADFLKDGAISGAWDVFKHRVDDNARRSLNGADGMVDRAATYAVNGEIDIVLERKSDFADILIEVKNSDKIHIRQARHLLDEAFIEQFQRTHGEVAAKVVAYNGPSAKTSFGVLYVNMEDILCRRVNLEMILHHDALSLPYVEWDAGRQEAIWGSAQPSPCGSLPSARQGKLTMLCGIPGSGKTEAAMELCRAAYAGWARSDRLLSMFTPLDAMREDRIDERVAGMVDSFIQLMPAKPAYAYISRSGAKQEMEAAGIASYNDTGVDRLVDARIRIALMLGHDVIYDAPNLSAGIRSHFLNLASSCGAGGKELIVIDAGVDEAAERAAATGQGISKGVLASMRARLHDPFPSEREGWDSVRVCGIGGAPLAIGTGRARAKAKAPALEGPER